MRHFPALAGLGLLVAENGPASAAKPVGAAEAERIADATVKAWLSSDAARINALYAPGIVGFDPDTAPLATDRTAWDRLQDAYTAAKFDTAKQRQRTIQRLVASIFVVSGLWELASTAIPENRLTLRCADVYQKAGAGHWSIVTKHCPVPPTG